MKWKNLAVATLLSLCAGAAWATGKVNINTADAETLATELTGIGTNKGAAIVSYRENNGPFKTIFELVKVKGIGKKTVELNAEKLTTEDN